MPKMCVRRMGLPPIIVEDGTAGSRSFPSPVGIGSPDSVVAILLEILILDDRTGWQGDSSFVPRFRQQNQEN